MATSAKNASRLRIALMWVAMVGLTVAIMGFFFWRGVAVGHHPAEETEMSPPPLFHAVFFLLAGGFFLVLGVAGYLIVIFTGCFTFDYRRPIWNALKVKQYLANIFVPVGLGLGGGFILSAFLSPTLTALGLDAPVANLVPLFAVIAGFQVLQFWVLIWAPVEKHIITRRLAAQGITPEHLRGATLVGLSNPASGLVKRFGAIEEDMGALWLTPEHLMFRGDEEQFDLTRDQLADVERRTDNRSVTVLAGIAHVILHVRLPDGSVRPIRLHTEALWTLGQKKRAMDALAEKIEQWRAGVVG